MSEAPAAVQIDPTPAVPPFEQMRSQLATNTVARAYRELEIAGLVATRGRAGTIVTAHGDRGRERLAAAAHAYAHWPTTSTPPMRSSRPGRAQRLTRG